MNSESFDGICFEVTTPLRPITVAELESAERELGCRFPSDYREFVLRFGSGEIRELTLRILSPSEIVEVTPGDRARLSEHWFWQDSPEVWTQQRALESIACFDGSCGDDIRFHPADPGMMYLLPHEDSVIHKFEHFSEIVRHFQCEYAVDSDRLTFTV